MAAADKLWFELGVRDEISQVLENLMKSSEKLANALTDDTVELKNIYKNIVDISNVYDKIYVAQKRISSLKGISLTADEKKGLRGMSKELEEYRKQFSAIFKNPDRLTESGEVKFDKMRLNFDLLLKDVLRYVDNIESKDAAEAKNAANESKRIDDLKSKYYELQRYRKQLSDAIVGAAPGADLTSATSLINGISGRMSAVTRAQNSGKGLPMSVTGADYEEFLRKVKAELNSLASATGNYNNKLEQNKQILSSLNRLKADTVSQQTIAGIKKQTSEYTALGRKIREIEYLIASVNNEQAGISRGSVSTPRYTKDRVTEELNAIQRRYNEALAAGRQRELDDAAAKNQKAAATRKAMEAVSALAHVNQGLISSYNRVAEAGSQANRITIQLQQQIGAYAGLYGLERILKSVITIGGQFEVQHVALQNILGDVQQANILFGQLKELAIESPKTFMELTSYAKQLSAYQIPAEELFDTTKRLADMSSGLGVDTNRLILAYGQVRSASVLRGQELRQFTEAGIPMVQALADKFTQLNGKLTTTADVFKLISARAVPFEMVKEVLWDMTSQGGQFFNMQEELANTLYGKWQKLQDSWQIMLGSIAEGTNASGYMMKKLLDLVVFLTQHLDKMVFTLSALGTAKGIKYLTEGVQNTIMRNTGNMAIRNMEIAKLKEANRLERERLWNGRQLSTQEQQLVMNKNRLVSSDYQILALENQISAKKAHQLMLDGQMSKQHFYRYLQMQGYTREQRKQIALGNLQALQTGPNPQKMTWMGRLFGVGAAGTGTAMGKFLGFMGGWVGVAISAIGILTTLYEFIGQSDERLNDLANSISGGAERNANQLADTLKNVENSSDDAYKKVEALEESLLGMGTAGKQVVQDSRGFEDIGKRLENLTENAKAYQEALEAMGTPEGKSSIKEALENSDINDEMDELEELQNAEYKRMNALEKYSSKYQEMIDAMIVKHKELKDELTSKNLYENLRKLLTGDYAQEAGGYFASNTPYGSALLDYAKAVEETEAHLKRIKDETIPDAMDSLKALAREAGVDISKSYEELTDAEKTKLRTVATGFANGLEKGSKDAKDSIASWISQGFYAQLYLTPVLNVNDLTGLSLTLDEWQKGKGYGLWNKNDLKDANNDFLAFSKKQSQRKVDLEKTVKDFDNQLKNTLLRPDLIPTIQSQRDEAQTELDKLNASLDEGLWTFDKSLTKGSKGGGSKKDEALEQLRTRLDEVKKFYAEYKKYRDVYGAEKGQSMVEEMFGMKKGEGDRIVKNYKEVLEEIRKEILTGNSEQRKKAALSVGQTLGEIDLDAEKKKIDLALNELQEYLSRQTEKWNLYKTILEKTGDQRLAGMAFGDGKIWTDLAREFADELRTRMEEAAKPLPDVAWDMTNAEAKEYFEGVQGGYETWKKVVDLIRGEYRDALTKGADAEAQLLTVSDKIRKNEEEIARLRKEGANVPGNEARIRVLQKENDSKLWEQFQQGSDYLRFFGAVLTMTNSEVEQTARMIKERLITELSRGTISAHQYTKSLKEVDDQLTKSREAFGGYLGTLLQSGIKGVVDRRSEDVQNAAIRVEAAKKEREEIEGRLRRGEEVSALERMTAITEEIEAKQRLEAAAKALGISVKQYQTLTSMESVLGVVNGVLEGLQHVATSLSQMFDALGDEGNANYFSDMADTIGGISSVLTPVNNLVQSVKNGNISGAISSALSAPVDLIAGPITAFAKLNDKQLQREIEASAQRQKEMERLTSNLERLLERSIGGIYGLKVSKRQIAALQETAAWQRSGFGVQRSYTSKEAMDALKEAEKTMSYYDARYASLLMQRDELAYQMELEEEKKDSDSDKIADYKQQLVEMEDEIEYFAKDMAKALWDIDVKSWAKELTDTIVDAWKNGENAVDAYKNKVKEMMLDLTTNILSQRVMEKMLDDVGLNTLIENLMTSTKGELNADAVSQLADKLNEVSEKGATTITAILDKMEEQGYISKGDEGSSGSSASIKGITEQTADLLAAYINSIRADVSMKRVMEAEYYPKFLAAMSRNMLTEAQEKSLLNIAAYTKRNAEAAEGIMELLRRVETGATKFNVR